MKRKIKVIWISYFTVFLTHFWGSLELTWKKLVIKKCHLNHVFVFWIPVLLYFLDSWDTVNVFSFFGNHIFMPFNTYDYFLSVVFASKRILESANILELIIFHWKCYRSCSYGFSVTEKPDIRLIVIIIFRKFSKTTKHKTSFKK